MSYLARSADADDGVENEVNNGESEKRDDKADNCVEDGIFCVSNLFTVAAGKDVA